jgi:hypothetical protein
VGGEVEQGAQGVPGLLGDHGALYPV